ARRWPWRGDLLVLAFGRRRRRHLGPDQPARAAVDAPWRDARGDPGPPAGPPLTRSGSPQAITEPASVGGSSPLPGSRCSREDPAAVDDAGPQEPDRARRLRRGGRGPPGPGAGGVGPRPRRPRAPRPGPPPAPPTPAASPPLRPPGGGPARQRSPPAGGPSQKSPDPRARRSPTRRGPRFQGAPGLGHVAARRRARGRLARRSRRERRRST